MVNWSIQGTFCQWGGWCWFCWSISWRWSFTTNFQNPCLCQIPRCQGVTFPLFCLAFLVDPLFLRSLDNPAVEMIKTSYWDIHEKKLASKLVTVAGFCIIHSPKLWIFLSTPTLKWCGRFCKSLGSILGEINTEAIPMCNIQGRGTATPGRRRGLECNEGGARFRCPF